MRNSDELGIIEWRVSIKLFMFLLKGDVTCMLQVFVDVVVTTSFSAFMLGKHCEYMLGFVRDRFPKVQLGSSISRYVIAVCDM